MLKRWNNFNNFPRKRFDERNIVNDINYDKVSRVQSRVSSDFSRKKIRVKISIEKVDIVVSNVNTILIVITRAKSKAIESNFYDN